MIMDTLRGVESFIRSVEEGSIAAAARRLGITPAAASQNIARLERSLGTRLLQRTTRKLGLTESGQVYYDRVRHVIADLEQAGEAVSSLQETPRGPLKIAASVAFGRHVIAPLVPAFVARHPDIRVELVITDSVVDHIREGVDISVRFAEQLEASLIARKLATVPMVLCASPAYLERRGRPRGPEDLLHHDCLVYRFAGHGRLFHWTFLNNGVLFERAIEAKLISNDIDTLTEMAIAGAGIARLGAFICEPLIAQGLLMPLFSRYPGELPEPGKLPEPVALPERGEASGAGVTTSHTPFDFYACYVDRQAETPKIRAFIDHAVTSLKGRWRGA